MPITVLHLGKKSRYDGLVPKSFELSCLSRVAMVKGLGHGQSQSRLASGSGCPANDLRNCLSDRCRFHGDSYAFHS